MWRLRTSFICCRHFLNKAFSTKTFQWSTLATKNISRFQEDENVGTLKNLGKGEPFGFGKMQLRWKIFARNFLPDIFPFAIFLNIYNEIYMLFLLAFFKLLSHTWENIGIMSYSWCNILRSHLKTQNKLKSYFAKMLACFEYFVSRSMQIQKLLRFFSKSG